MIWPATNVPIISSNETRMEIEKIYLDNGDRIIFLIEREIKTIKRNTRTVQNKNVGIFPA